MFIIVRHAQPLAAQDWDGLEPDRPLTASGQRQAEVIADSLVGIPLRRLLSSPYVRCRQTIGPLARRLDVPITTSGLLGPDASAETLMALLRSPSCAGVALCTHGETLTALRRYWVGRRPAGLPWSPREIDEDVTEEAAAWVVELSGNGLAATHLPRSMVRDVS